MTHAVFQAPCCSRRLWLPAAVPVSGAELTEPYRLPAGPAQHAVVWLEAQRRRPRSPAQKSCSTSATSRSSPHVLGVRVGTTVEFPNNDRVFHNVFSFRDGKKFDLGMYPKGTVKRIIFDKPGLARLFCNIHPNMAAYVMAVDSPYFAVSNENGAFTISGVPPGTYTYHAWRPGGQPLTGSVSVDGNTPLEIRW